MSLKRLFSFSLIYAEYYLLKSFPIDFAFNPSHMELCVESLPNIFIAFFCAISLPQKYAHCKFLPNFAFNALRHLPTLINWLFPLFNSWKENLFTSPFVLSLYICISSASACSPVKPMQEVYDSPFHSCFVYLLVLSSECILVFISSQYTFSNFTSRNFSFQFSDNHIPLSPLPPSLPPFWRNINPTWRWLSYVTTLL